MTAVMIGVGECFTPHGRVPAKVAFVSHGLQPVTLGAKEGLALLNGTQFSTAYALAALFEAEVLYQSALVTGALSTDAAKGSDAPFDPRIHALRKHRGQIETAKALRELMAGSADPRIASRRRRARAGPVLPALSAAGDGRRTDRAPASSRDARNRGQRRHRQSADLSGRRHSALRRQFPRRTGGLRRRHDRARASARSDRSPNAASPCWSTPRCRACRRS